MAVTIEDIIKKEFSRSLMGYDMQEVDVFLDSIIDRIERMEIEREELIATMEKLLKRVERLEKPAEGKAAIESGEKPARKLTTGKAVSGHVHVQSAKVPADAVADDRPARREPPPQAQRKPTRGAVRKDAPAFSKPIRPTAQPVRPAAQPVHPAAEPAHPTAEPVVAVPPQPQPMPEVAIEMETGVYAPDGGELIPELLSDIESALLESSILPASRKETPVRAADKSRVS